MNGFANVFVEFADFGMKLAVEAGAAAIFLAAAALLINVIARRWLTPGQMALIWSLVLLRLVIPAGPQSAFSFQNVRQLFASESAAPVVRDVVKTPGSTASYGSPYNAGYSGAVPNVRQDPHIKAPSLAERVFAVAPVVWLLAAVGSFAFTFLLHMKFARAIKRANVCGDESLLQLWGECRSLAGVRRKIPVVLFEGVSQPAVMGVFRPRLILPLDAADLSEVELRMVMLHELAHVRRWDVAANWGMLFVRSIQWWNPIYWMAASRFKALREQACDRFVINAMSGAARASYGELLLKLAARSPDPGWRVMVPASMLGFNASLFRRRSVQSRLAALRTNVTQRRRTWIAAAMLVVIVAVGGFTDGTTGAEPPASKPQVLADGAKSLDAQISAGVEAEKNPIHGMPTPVKGYPAVLATKSYAIAPVIERIAKDSPSLQVARKKCEAMLKGFVEGLHTDPASSVVFSDDGATMTVKTSQGGHYQIAQNLATWSKSGFAKFVITCRHISSPRDITSSLGSIWIQKGEPLSDDETSKKSNGTNDVIEAPVSTSNDLIGRLAIAVLTPKQVEQLIKEAKAGENESILLAPTVTAMSGQSASFSFGAEIPFVAGFRRDAAGNLDAKGHIQPEGLSITLRATPAGDGRNVHLDESLEFRTNGEVFSAPKSDGGAIQVSRVRSTAIAAAQEIGPDDTVLLGCVPSQEKKEFAYILLTARRLELKDE